MGSQQAASARKHHRLLEGQFKSRLKELGSQQCCGEELEKGSLLYVTAVFS